MERLAGANGVFLTTRLIRRLVSTGALIGFAFLDLYGVGEGQVHSPRVQEEAARLGVLSADVAEMIDDYQSLGTPSRQAVIDSTFDAIERTSANAGIAQRFVALRPQFVSIKGRADQQSVFSAYTSATHAYVATLPTAIGRCFVIGTGLRQVYYNATGSRNVEADVRERALLSQLDEGDAFTPDFAELRRRLGTVPVGDFGDVAKTAGKLLGELTNR